MILNLKNNILDNKELFALTEALRQKGHLLGNTGVPLYISKISDGLTVSVKNGVYEVGVSTRTSLMRAIGILCGHLEDVCFETEQRQQKETLSVMLDCSRNAVLNQESRREFCRIIAMMGYNAIMLYTEDTYHIDGNDYFGHQRASLSQAELQALDDYCDVLGIELIPCIQTLAHLNTFFHWPSAQKYRDCNDILLLESEETYQLIDSMLSSMSKSIRSRRINIGMDEASMLGRGAYLKQHDYQPSSQLMKKHLQRVLELCKKYGYKPMMWSDMFFNMIPNITWYYDMNVKLTEEIISIVPPEVTLIYWDYYGTNASKYEHMFKQHSRFRNEIIFAGGASCWYGMIPLNHYSVNSARVALSVAEKYPVDFLLVTMWGDDGGMCSPFSAMPTLQLYGEYAWGCEITDEALSRRLKESADADFDAFMSMEDAQKVPTRQHYGHDALTPTRYMFYQDALIGLFDKHVPKGSNEHFSERAEFYNKYTDGKWGYLFRPIQKLCQVLSQKAELGCQFKAAYDAGDKETLKKLAEKIPQIVSDIEAFHGCFREQWMHDNCRIGFEVQDIRVGALIFRLKQIAEIVLSYVNGEIDRIEELEAERLYYRIPAKGQEKEVVCSRVNSWAKMLTANLFSQSLHF